MGPFPEIEGRYSRVQVVTEGPPASLARAVDAASGAAVYLKCIFPPSAGAGAPAAPAGDPAADPERLARALGSLAELRHPALPALRDFDISAEGGAWLAFEPVPGGDAGLALDALAGAPPAQILPLLLQAADGLEALAGRGLVHLNLALENLVVLPNFPGDEERLAIFGLGTGFLHRTPAPGRPAATFAAPELASPPEAARADRRADLFSLALLACRLLEARVDGAGTAAPSIWLPLAVTFELEDAETLQQALERCLWRDPRERPGSFEELRRALRRALPQGRSQAPRARLTFVTAEEGEPPGEPPAEPSAGPEEEDPGDSTNPVLAIDGPAPFPLSLELTINHPPPAAGLREDTAVFIPPPPAAPRPPVAPRQETALPAPAVEPAAPGSSASWFVPVESAPAGLEATEVPATPEDTTGFGLPAFLPAEFAPPAFASAETPPIGESAAELLPSLDPLAASPIGTAPATAYATSAAGASASLAPGASAPAPVPRGARPAMRASGSRLPLFISLGAAALLAVAAGLLWLAHRETPAVAETSAAAIAALPPSTRGGTPAATLPAVLHPALATAAGAFAAGDDAAARRALAAFGPAGQGGVLSPADCQALMSLERALELSRVDRLSAELAGGLRTGDVPRLTAAARSVSPREQAQLAAADPALVRNLAEARRAADLYGRLEQAEAGADPLLALEAAGAVAAAFPAWKGADERRERVATAIESEADGLLQKGDVDAAHARLEALERAWPDRPGLAERQARVGSERRSDREMERLLATAAATGGQHRPDEGLALLKGAKASPRLEGRLRETRARLERALAEQDSAAPQIALDGALPEVEKGAPVALRFRVTDDYRVTGVTCRARPDGGAWSELPVHCTGADCAVEIPAALHGNRAVELTLVATDLSGHQAELGPRQLKRKRWFDRLRPRRGGDKEAAPPPG